MADMRDSEWVLVAYFSWSAIIGTRRRLTSPRACRRHADCRPPHRRCARVKQGQPIERALFALGLRHVNAADAMVRNLARAVVLHAEHLFTFLYEERVEPTNNAAERALRTAVQWRKSCSARRVLRANALSNASSRSCARVSCSNSTRSAISRPRLPPAHRRGQAAPSLLRGAHTP